MKIYLISQNENQRWDTYDSAVVYAPDEETARNIDPGRGLKIKWDDDETHFSNYWCREPKNVKVEYLGEANDEFGQGVICASFHAG